MKSFAKRPNLLRKMIQYCFNDLSEEEKSSNNVIKYKLI